MSNTAAPLSCKAAVKNRQRKCVLKGRPVNIIKNKPKSGTGQEMSRSAAMSKGGKKPRITATSKKPNPGTAQGIVTSRSKGEGSKGAKTKRIGKDRLEGKGDATQGQKGKRGGRRANGTKRSGRRDRNREQQDGKVVASLKNVKMSWNEEEQAFVQKS